MILNFLLLGFWMVILYLSGKILISALQKIAALTKMQKFAVSFLIMATASSLPNLFVGITSAIDNVPRLSFGEVAGGNIVDITIAIALATLFSKTGIPAKEKTIQTTAWFAGAAGILPFILVLDKTLSRSDGIILLGFFAFYLTWLFSKKDRFKQIYEIEKNKKISKKDIFKEILKIILGVLILIIASSGIVNRAILLSTSLGLSIAVIGVLLVGLGNALPETYFAIASAKAGETDFILGDLLGSIITPTTFVLGIVALINPFTIPDPSVFYITRIFLIIGIILALVAIKTGRKISKPEAIILFAIYTIFIATEIINLI